MEGSWFDHLPSKERERIRKRMRSPEAYEALRDKVKGPEDLEKELKRAEHLAELHFAIESDPKAAENLKEHLVQDISERGMEAVLEHTEVLSQDVKDDIREGNFSIAVLPHPGDKQDALIVLPEGNIQDRIPVKPAMTDHYAGHAMGTIKHHEND